MGPDIWSQKFRILKLMSLYWKFFDRTSDVNASQNYKCKKYFQILVDCLFEHLQLSQFRFFLLNFKHYFPWRTNIMMNCFNIRLLFHPFHLAFYCHFWCVFHIRCLQKVSFFIATHLLRPIPINKRCPSKKVFREKAKQTIKPVIRCSIFRAFFLTLCHPLLLLCQICLMIIIAQKNYRKKTDRIKISKFSNVECLHKVSFFFRSTRPIYLRPSAADSYQFFFEENQNFKKFQL